MLKGLLFLLFIVSSVEVNAQSSVTHSVNISGSSAVKGNINFEWSVGESVLIQTFSNNNFLLTQGLLQGYTATKPTIGFDVYTFQANEVKIYPNPISTYFNIDIMSSLSGMMEWVVYNNNGSKLRSGQFSYNGEGKTIRVDMTGVPLGSYFLKLIIWKTGAGFTLPLREAGYKLIKVNQ